MFVVTHDKGFCQLLFLHPGKSWNGINLSGLAKSEELRAGVGFTWVEAACNLSLSWVRAKPPDGFLAVHFNKKLYCRRETVPCFVSLNILLSHSRSFEISPISRACVFNGNCICICYFRFRFTAAYKQTAFCSLLFVVVCARWTVAVVVRTSHYTIDAIARYSSRVAIFAYPSCPGRPH